jgi:hypothetical protein
MRLVLPIYVGVVLVVLAGQGFAEPPIPVPPPPPPDRLPDVQTGSAPIVVPAPPSAPDAAPLSGGVEVSQPLQPVGPLPKTAELDLPTPPAEPIKLPTDRNPRPGHVLGQFWDSDEFLLWWPKAQPLPPLITGSRTGVPLLGQPQTTLIVGNRGIDNQDIAGYRGTIGYSLNDEDTVGFEGKYFFLGTRTLTTSVSDLSSDRFRSLGLPYVNAVTGQEDVLTLASPGQSSAQIAASTTTRAQGAEANVVANLYAEPGLKLHALVGYRFLQVNEGLLIDETYLQYPTPQFGNTKTLGLIADQFDARNEFNGMQLGLLADAHHGMFYVELTGKVGLGINTEVVRVDGVTHLITAANPVPILQSYPGGVYALPSNMGQVKQAVFAVVPEGIFKTGLKLGDRGRFYVGYNFLYLNNAVRAGNQVNTTINPAQIPLLNPGGTYAGPERPEATFTRSDFWLQGLIIGFETRF